MQKKKCVLGVKNLGIGKKIRFSANKKFLQQKNLSLAPDEFGIFEQQVLFAEHVAAGKKRVEAYRLAGFINEGEVRHINGGAVLLAMFDGRNHLFKKTGAALISEDGESIEGDALNGVEVSGVVTQTIHRVRENNQPV